MAASSGMYLRVNSETLLTASSEVESQVDSMRKQFDQVNEIVNRSSGYWEGEGQEAYLKAYRSKYEGIEEALNRFSSHVVNLQTMAGVYKAAEAEAVEETESLLSDVIV
ncbi:MAG: WXG100 family type VII secretion target [Lachnospiraceae bacterium]|nr:WXG100 family type VII secretion target [Lachnospiraceae bacterium]